jgi:hypothetical protein
MDTSPDCRFVHRATNSCRPRYLLRRAPPIGIEIKDTVPPEGQGGHLRASPVTVFDNLIVGPALTAPVLAQEGAQADLIVNRTRL